MSFSWNSVSIFELWTEKSYRLTGKGPEERNMNGQRSRKEDFERKSRQVVFSLVFSLKKNVSEACVFKEGEEVNRNT